MKQEYSLNKELNDGVKSPNIEERILFETVLERDKLEIIKND